MRTLHPHALRTLSGAALLLGLLAGPGVAANPLKDWEQARQAAAGVCADRRAGRTVAKADFERLTAQEASARDVALRASEAHLVAQVLAECKAEHNVARERALTWALAQLEHVRDLLASGPDMLERSPGRSTELQRAAFLDALDQLQAGLARVEPESAVAAGRALPDEQADELLFVLARLFEATEPLVAAGAKLKPKVVREGLKLSQRVSSAAGRESQGLALKARFDAGERVAALAALDGLLPAGAEAPPSVVQARRARKELLEAVQAHDKAQGDCTGPVPGASAQAEPPTATASPAPAGSAPAAGAQSGLKARIAGWADKVVSDPGRPLPSLELGYVLADRWLVDPAAAALTSDGSPLRQRCGGLVLPVDLLAGLDRPLAAAPTPPDATAEHFAGVGAGDRAARREDLRRALQEGKRPAALAAYLAITGIPAAEAEPVVDALLAEARAKQLVERAALRAPAPGGPLGGLPPAAAGRKPEVALQQARAALAAKAPARTPPRRFAPPSELRAPASRTDGRKDHEEQLVRVRSLRLEQSGSLVSAPAQELASKHAAAVSALEQANRAAAEAHMGQLRTRAYGPAAASCPAGYELCGCPERQPPENLRGQCCPAGVGCTGTPPTDLSFK